MSEESTKNSTPLAEKTILFVDDNKDETERHRKILHNLGAQIETSTSPNRAWHRIKTRIAEQKPYDLVILDLFMPKDISDLVIYHKDKFKLNNTNQGRLLAAALDEISIPYLYLCNDMQFFGEDQPQENVLFLKSEVDVNNLIAAVNKILNN